jgi:hypothetical protein
LRNVTLTFCAACISVTEYFEIYWNDGGELLMRQIFLPVPFRSTGKELPFAKSKGWIEMSLAKLKLDDLRPRTEPRWQGLYSPATGSDSWSI